jgi:hypothetical protein
MIGHHWEETEPCLISPFKYQAISNLTFWIFVLWRQVSLIRFALVRIMSKNLCSGTYYLSDMSWPETQQALETVRVALMAVGSTEQHGPNLAMQADTAQAHAFATKLAQRFYPKVLLAPPLHVGISDHHMDFPGSLTLCPETFYAFLHDVIESLSHHGLTKFLLVNGHGGNAATLGMSLVRLKPREIRDRR